LELCRGSGNGRAARRRVGVAAAGVALCSSPASAAAGHRRSVGG